MFGKTTRLITLSTLSLLTVTGFSANLAAAASDADDIREPYYIGLSLGSSFLTPETGSVALTLSQDSDIAYRLFGGYQFDDHWALEAFWSDLGQAEISTQSTGSVAGTIDYKAYGIGGLYQYPFAADWQVFATLGAGRFSNSAQMIVAERVEDNYIYAGGGVLWNMADTWDLRAEYDYYDTDAQLLSLSIVKRFGSKTNRRIVELENKVQQQEEVIAATTATTTAAVTASAGVEKQDGCKDYAVTLEGVVFERRSVDLNAKVKQKLDAVAQQLLALPEDIKFEIRAHTDNEGTELYNYTLSLARARNVRDYFAAHGIALSRIDAQGYGEWRPVQSNDTEAGRKANRRAELVLLGVEKYVKDTSGCPKLAAP